MNQPSNFQLTYPLSPKKFWKKIIPKLTGWVVLLVVIFIVGNFFLVPFKNVDGQELGVVSVFLTIFKIISGLILIPLIIYPIYIKAYIKRYYYDCGDQFVTIKKGVFAPTEIHVQYPKIQDVYVDQDILDRIMGLYDVHIASATATSGIEAHIDGVEFQVAEDIKNIILNRIRIDHSQGPAAQTNSAVSEPKASGPVKLNEEISTKTYPISNSWMAMSVIKSIFINLVWSLILANALVTILAKNFLSLWLILFLIIFAIRIIYLIVWKKNYFFEFNPEFILLRTAVLSKQENHLPYKSIQNISTSQGIIERMFGLATVSIENAAQVLVDPRRGTYAQSGINIVGQPVKKAEHINQVLNSIVSQIKNSSSTGL